MNYEWVGVEQEHQSKMGVVTGVQLPLRAYTTIYNLVMSVLATFCNVHLIHKDSYKIFQLLMMH